MSGVTARTATVDDAEAIRAIYNTEVTTATSTFDLVPRSLEDQRRWLRERSGAFAAIVAVDDSHPGSPVAGFASLSPYKDRAAYSTTVEDSVYVDRAFTGKGVGTLLLSRLVDIARTSGFHTVIARIEASGMTSRALHAKCGFELVGIERQVGRKFGRWLDVAVMQRLL
jgi:phosphinothricin acetyltransferase